MELEKYPKSKDENAKFKVVITKSFQYKETEKSPLEILKVGMVKELYLHDCNMMISANKAVLYEGKTEVGKVDKEFAEKFVRAGGGKKIEAGKTVGNEAIVEQISALAEKIDKLADALLESKKK